MLFALLSLLTVTAAIRVTSPSSSTVWSSGTSAQTVTWEAVSSDPTTFVIQLVNQAGFLSNSPVTLKEGQSTGSPNTQQSTTVTFPGSWPVGTAFQINLVTSTSSNQAILAQSSQFNISNSGSVQSQTQSQTTQSQTQMTPTTVQAMSTATTVTMTSDNSLASGGIGSIPNSATSSKSAGEKPSPSAFISLLITAATFFGIFA